MLGGRVLCRPHGSAARGLPAEQLRSLPRGGQHAARARRHRVHLCPAAWQLLHKDGLLAAMLTHISCTMCPAVPPAMPCQLYQISHGAWRN